MLRWSRAIPLAILICIVVAFAYAVTHATISALPEPSGAETFIANHVKDWYVRAASRRVPPAPPLTPARAAAGKNLYGMDCAFCHGQDPHTLAPLAHSMYPRVLNLSSPAVQRLSNREMFWVIQHGIRMTAMPGFARINSDDEIWEITAYVRSLGR